MKVEIRNDGVHISGYVNAVMRESHPVITREDGVVNELIEEKAFQRALEKAQNVEAWLDHDDTKVIAMTKDQTLQLREDNIGLHAELFTSDKEVVNNASKLTGWSFGFKNPKGVTEQRADKLPLRRVSELDLDHVALLLHKQPAYSATSVELRAEEEQSIEIRSTEDEVDLIDKPVETPKEAPNNAKFFKQITRD